MEEEIENFIESVELMIFVYALAAVVSFLMAGVIKLIFAGVRMQKARAGVPPESGDDAPDKAP